MKFRPFAYNPSRVPIAGTTQFGDLAIGVDNQDYFARPGGVKWFAGPDEDLGYIIAVPYSAGNAPTADGENDGTLQFWRSASKTDEAFISIVNYVSRYFLGPLISTVNEAIEWLGENEYWSSYSSFINPPLTIGSAVTTVSQSPFIGGGNSYSFISSTNSYITTPGNIDWAVGTGDFTVEWFSYQTTLNQFQRIFTVGDFPAIRD